jgi:hypothetical protein
VGTWSGILRLAVVNVVSFVDGGILVLHVLVLSGLALGLGFVYDVCRVGDCLVGDDVSDLRGRRLARRTPFVVNYNPSVDCLVSNLWLDRILSNSVIAVADIYNNILVQPQLLLVVGLPPFLLAVIK